MFQRVRAVVFSFVCLFVCLRVLQNLTKQQNINVRIFAFLQAKQCKRALLYI